MEELFDKDITIINKYFNKDEKKTAYKVSYVKGFWSSSNAVTIKDTQLVKADGLIAKILINDSRNTTYQKPEEFEEEQGTWTLKPDDYLVKGKVEDFTSITELLKNYQEVMKISNVSNKDYGSEDMWHFAITGG